jgi:hypothetical protein
MPWSGFGSADMNATKSTGRINARNTVESRGRTRTTRRFLTVRVHVCRKKRVISSANLGFQGLEARNVVVPCGCQKRHAARDRERDLALNDHCH